MSEVSATKFTRILDKFDPETWEEGYRGRLGNYYDESVLKLVELERLDETEADVKLMSILIQTTFVQRNLCVNGAQTAEQLFENFESLTDQSPFSSAEDVARFCTELSPLFIKCPLSQRIQNTGAGFQKFCVYLKNLIDLGTVVDDKTLHGIIQDFSETIPDKGNYGNFLKKELFVEFDSLRFLAVQVPLFQYDESSTRLSLSPEAATHLSSALPIFLHTFDADHPFLQDTSRMIRPLVKMSGGFNMISQGVCILPDYLRGANVVMRTMENEEGDKVIVKPHGYWQIKGAISPNNYKAQVEVQQATHIPTYIKTESMSRPKAQFHAPGTNRRVNFETKTVEVEELARQTLTKKERPDKQETQ